MSVREPFESGLTVEMIEGARTAAQNSGASLLSALEEQSGLDSRALTIAMGRLFEYSVLDTARMLALKPAFDRISLPKAQARLCALLSEEDRLIAVVADPFDVKLRDWIQAQARTDVDFRLAPPADIRAYLARQEESVRAFDALTVNQPAEHADQSKRPVLSLQSISEDDSPSVKLVNSTLYDALKEGASDVHLRRTPAGIQVKYRIDGVLVTAAHIDGAELADRMVSHIKVRAELNIAEHRVPQDGKFRISYGDRSIDLRVSVMPTIHGEGVVLRILDKHTVVGADGHLHLHDLGFDDATLATLRRLINLPYGMLMVTGPTGSGKTTTLYAAITEINQGGDNFMTVEDPPEYQFEDVAQIRVNEAQGLTFAVGLRSILRHDPDKIMVGEIRDQETADMAIQAALTGHSVFTTLHANNSFDVFSRLAYMNIDPYALTSALNGIWAQRLLRMICTRCATPDVPSTEVMESLGLAPNSTNDYRFMRGAGCGDCHGTGYRGRKAIAEIMVMTDRLREMIAAKAPIASIKEEARLGGTRYLREAALDLVKQGETTLEEVARVTLSA